MMLQMTKQIYAKNSYFEINILMDNSHYIGQNVITNIQKVKLKQLKRKKIPNRLWQV